MILCTLYIVDILIEKPFKEKNNARRNVLFLNKNSES